MDRRDFLSAALPFAGLFSRCRRLWGHYVSTAVPANNPTWLPVAMAAHDDYRIYTAGNFRVTLGMPRAAVTSTGTSDPAWFAGVHRDPVTSKIMLRWSYNADGDVGDGFTRALISSDNGQTFPAATLTTVTGKPSPQEPCVMESSGTFHGYEFGGPRWVFVGGNRRILQCGYNTWTNGFSSYVYTASSATFSGFPADLTDFSGVPAISGTDRIIRISDVQWITVVPVIMPTISNGYVGACFESTDQGHAWTYVGATNSALVGTEGMSETSTFRMGNGDLICISRCGVGAIARSKSTDVGRTWSAVDRTLGAWCKSPCADLLSSGDIALITGYVPQSPYVVQGLAPAGFGLYLSSSPTAANWPVVDLITHHNAMVGSTLAYDDTLNSSTGYGNFQELSGGTSTKANLLIVYDQSGGGRGTGTTRPNRIFVVNATVERMS